MLDAGGSQCFDNSEVQGWNQGGCRPEGGGRPRFEDNDVAVFYWFNLMWYVSDTWQHMVGQIWMLRIATWQHLSACSLLVERGVKINKDRGVEVGFVWPIW